MTSIGGKAFSECSSLTSIIIPKNVSYVGSDAFSGCDKINLYCEAISKPSNWDNNWNRYTGLLGIPQYHTIVWGYKI